MASPDPQALLAQRARQFLLHSFLYYRLQESVVDDATFDRWTKELRALRTQYPEAPLPHAEVVDPALGPEATGYLIRTYPPETVSAAFKVLYGMQRPEADFPDFVERHGYRVEAM